MATPSAELCLSLWGGGGSRAESPSWLWWQLLSLGQGRETPGTSLPQGQGDAGDPQEV